MARRASGDGTVYQRGDGQWVGAVSLGKVNGKRERKYVYGKTKKEASEKRRELERQIKQGVISSDTSAAVKETVGTFLDRWIESVIYRKNKIKTAEGHEKIVQSYLKPAIGHIKIAKLTTDHVQALVNNLVDRGLAPNTVRNVRAVLRCALNYAIKRSIITQNAAKYVDMPQMTQAETTSLDAEQASAFLWAIQGGRLEALYIVLLIAGPRRGEALGLEWNDINFELNTIRIRQALQRSKKNGLSYVTPKNKKSVRTIHVPHVVIDALKAHRERQEIERVLYRWKSDNELVFKSTTGAPLDPDYVTHHVKDMLRKADLPIKIRLHDLRHSCATILLENDVPIRVVMDILGHDKIGTTMNFYAHALDQGKKDAANTMGHVFLAKKPRQADE